MTTGIAKVGAALMRISGRTGLIVAKHSPTILLGLGTCLVIGGAVKACSATLKVGDTITRHNEKLAEIKKCKELIAKGEIDAKEYTKEDERRDIAVIYVQTAVDFVKLYGPPIIMGVAGIACIIGGHRILQGRNIALMAAYKGLDQAFKKYRNRVIEDFGEERDYIYRNNLRAEKITITETDKKGKTKEVTVDAYSPEDPNNFSIYARWFDKDSSINWSPQSEYNLTFLKTVQNYWNDMLQIRGHVFLNEVYDGLGLERSQAGAIVGWVKDGNTGDNYIDFGIYDPRQKQFLNGNNTDILLDFNVDGVVYDLI